MNELRFPGFGAFWLALWGGNVMTKLSALTNFVMLFMYFAGKFRRGKKALALSSLFFLMGLANLGWLVLDFSGTGYETPILGVGYYAWVASFFIVGAGLYKK